MTEFTVFCLLGSLAFNVIGIQHKFFPSKKYKWWIGVMFPSAHTSVETWREANSFIAFPSFVAGCLFLIISFLPEIFPELKFLNFRTAGFLILMTSIVLIFITDRHLKRNFDEHGNRKY